MDKEIGKKVEKIKAIYGKYLRDLATLKKQQSSIISKFIKEIEQRKIEEIRKILNQ